MRYSWFCSVLKNSILPLPLIPAAARYLAPAESAELSWVRVKARKLPKAARCPAIMMPIAASPAPAAIATAPRTIVALLLSPASLALPCLRPHRPPRPREQWFAVRRGPPPRDSESPLPLRRFPPGEGGLQRRAQARAQ